MALHVHFLGIGGSGASAIAALAQAQGYQISGCDKEPFNEFTQVFDQKLLFEGHSPEHLERVDILAVTPAIFSLDAQNPELLAAKKKGIPVITWQKFMGEYLEKDKFVIAVCGTHGKSTTTAMVGQLLEDAGLDPTVEIGAVVPKWQANYRVGKSRHFVTEADEFNENFLASHPDITIVTTIEMDHPEYYKDFTAYKASFAKFLGQTKGKIIANLADPGVKQTLAFHPKGGKLITDYSKELIDFSLKVPGHHNMMNASAVYQLGLALGIEPEVIKKSLENFTGIGRRFEYLGSYQGAEIYSDFAHHPTEIRVTLQAAREKFPDKRILVVFQPHMFSRTYALFNDFVQVLQDAPVEQIKIMDIYPSREIDTGLVNTHQLVEAIGKGSVTYLGPGNEVLDQIKDEFRKGDVVFFMGAGVTDKLAKEILRIQNKAQDLYKDKKVLILGLGINQGGLGATKFFAQAGAKVRVTDLKTKVDLQPSLDALKEFPEIEYTLGEHRYEDLDWADLIIKNPALKPDNPYVRYALEKGKQVEMDMGIFLQFVSPQQIIGVTGTKGKSTTASLIYEVLKNHLPEGKEVIFAGNIGKSVLETIPYIKENTLILLELSSFQLDAFHQHQTSPKWAVITNIYPDHLNYHGTMENYIEAKRAITKYQNPDDFLFIRQEDPATDTPQFLRDLKSQLIQYSLVDLPKNFAPILPGEHNLMNMVAALAVSNTLGILEKEALKTMEQFTGVEFRLQLIYNKDGIRIFNDSASTSPQAAIEALKSLPNSILICGGVNKNLPYDGLAKAICKQAKAVYFLEGDATEEIKNQFNLLNLKFKIIKGTYNNLETLLEEIKKEICAGDMILFSPGAASFNLFKNEFDRGHKFNQAVKKIFL